MIIILNYPATQGTAGRGRARLAHSSGWKTVAFPSQKMVPLRGHLSQAEGQLLANQGRSQRWFWCQITQSSGCPSPRAPSRDTPTPPHPIPKAVCCFYELCSVSSNSAVSKLPFPRSLVKQFPCKFFFVFFFFLFRTTPVADGSSEDTGGIRAAAPGLHPSHGNTGSKLHL